MKKFIILTSKTSYFAAKLKKNFQVVLSAENKVGEKVFADGEVYVKIPKINNLKKGKVIILHSGCPKPNEGLMELELILQILKEQKIKPELFFTYFPYSRQDKIFEKGETNAAENLIKKLVDYYKVRKIYAIDPHFAKRQWVKKYPIINLSAVPLLIEKAKRDFGKDIIFLSPDKGGKRRTGIKGLEKERIGKFIKLSGFSKNLKGRVVVAVDDIIGSGKTLLKFYKLAKKSGAEKVIALITHGVIPKGVKKVKKNFNKLYLTNSIAQKEANVDIVDLILENI
jgi:ribose-phosphate pyrophosphokinase